MSIFSVFLATISATPGQDNQVHTWPMYWLGRWGKGNLEKMVDILDKVGWVRPRKKRSGGGDKIHIIFFMARNVRFLLKKRSVVGIQIKSR